MMGTRGPGDTVPRFYVAWFYAAAAYNFVWAIVVIAAPGWVIRTLGVEALVSRPFLQVLAMMVGVYAYGYWLLAKDPIRYAGLAWIGLAGKVFGIAGFLFYASTGELPWRLGWTILTNDVVWLPAFASFVWRYARQPLG